MYFGGISGFNHFHPDEIQVNAHPPPVAITSFQTAIQEKQTDLLEGIDSLKITKKDLPIIIKMAALSFTFPQKNHYLVKALDDEQTEIHFGTSNSVYLRELKEGKNRFLIQGSNHDLVWNEEGIELTIHLTTPIFRSWILLVFILVAAAVASWFFYKHSREQWQSKSIKDIHIDLSILTTRFNLTKRERDVIALVFAGKTNKNMEKELFISSKTVKTHLYNIYRKFKVHNRLQLMNAIKDYLKKNQPAEK
jgi:DNA-binding CsgD family transcriptional regulator